MGKVSILLLAVLLVSLLGCSSGKGNLKEEDCPKPSKIIMLDDSDKG